MLSFRILYIVLVSIISTVFVGCSHMSSDTSKQAVLQNTPPVIEKIKVNNKGPDEAFTESLIYRQELRSNVYIIYKWYQCDVGWNQSCEGSVVLEAPPGWQVCSIYYEGLKQGGHGSSWSKSESSWYTNDPESPDRYRAISVYIHAWGNNDPVINPTGSIIRFDNLGLKLIPASANNYQRYAEGCSMPAHD